MTSAEAAWDTARSEPFALALFRPLSRQQLEAGAGSAPATNVWKFVTLHGKRAPCANSPQARADKAPGSSFREKQQRWDGENTGKGQGVSRCMYRGESHGKEELGADPEPKPAGESPSLEIFKTRLDKVLCSLL